MRKLLKRTIIVITGLAGGFWLADQLGELYLRKELTMKKYEDRKYADPVDGKIPSALSEEELNASEW